MFAKLSSKIVNVLFLLVHKYLKIFMMHMLKLQKQNCFERHVLFNI